MAILVSVMRLALRHLLMRDELRKEVMLGYISARLDNKGVDERFVRKSKVPEARGWVVA
jgi:hypothetical protein